MKKSHKRFVLDESKAKIYPSLKEYKKKNNNLSGKDENFNPSQPRDSQGRWAAGGGVSITTSKDGGAKLKRFADNEARTFKTKEEMAKYVHSYNKGMPPSDQLEAMNTWVDRDGCKLMQEAARGDNHSERYTDFVDGLDQAANSSTLRDDVNLFRGMTVTQDQVASLVENGKFKTNTFFTSSLDGEHIERYFASHGDGYSPVLSEGYQGEPALFRIRAKQGTKGVFTDSRWPSESYHSGLAEFVPSRDNTYDVVGVEYLENNEGLYMGAVVDLEVR